MFMCGRHRIFDEKRFFLSLVDNRCRIVQILDNSE